MANTYKVLGQAFPNANTNFSLYTVPAATSAIVSTLNVCNTTASNVTFRILVRPQGAAANVSQAIVFDAALPAQDAIGLTLGMTLGATDKVTVYSWQGNVAFSLFGTEIY